MPARHDAPAHWFSGRKLTIDTSRIPEADLDLALASAALDPDGEIYPWQPLYPLAGQQVLCEGQLWTVLQTETGACAGLPIATVKLAGFAHDDVMVATLSECRPVSWTQHEEDWLGCR